MESLAGGGSTIQGPRGREARRRRGAVKILGFNRVELLLPADEIDAAVAKFNDTFGFRLDRPHRVAGQPVLSTTDFAAGIELIASAGAPRPLAARLAQQGRGGRRRLVWGVHDL